MHYLHIFIFSVFSCGPHGRRAATAAAARHHGSQQNYMAVIGPKSRTVRSGLFGFWWCHCSTHTRPNRRQHELWHQTQSPDRRSDGAGIWPLTFASNQDLEILGTEARTFCSNLDLWRSDELLRVVCSKFQVSVFDVRFCQSDVQVGSRPEPESVSVHKPSLCCCFSPSGSTHIHLYSETWTRCELDPFLDGISMTELWGTGCYGTDGGWRSRLTGHQSWAELQTSSAVTGKRDSWTGGNTWFWTWAQVWWWSQHQNNNSINFYYYSKYDWREISCTNTESIDRNTTGLNWTELYWKARIRVNEPSLCLWALRFAKVLR